MSWVIQTDESLNYLKSLPDKSVDLVFTSPFYEDARTYGIDIRMKGQDWVDFMVPRFIECVRVCRGLVAWVVEGRTRAFRWSATPVMLMADLHRAGVKLRKPPIYQRNGIPGSGGPDWLRNDWEFIVCASHGRLPWSDNIAMGKPPVARPGGPMSHRRQDGERVQTRRKPSGVRARDGVYKPPKIANPGNIIRCGAAGGGNIGSKLAHENEAPFPEYLAEFFIRSFCPPGGTVLDPFCGSGTTVAMAHKHDRVGVGVDIRESQTELTFKRMMELTQQMRGQ